MAMTIAEYRQYQQRFADFREKEGLANLSSVSCEEYVSSQPCPCCNDTLQGMRQDCNGWSPRDKVVKTYENVCVDCVYYAEYGQLDDQTMIEMIKS